MASESLDGPTRESFDGWWLTFRNFDYVRTHLRHFSKCEAAIPKLRAVFESLYAWVKHGQYCSTGTKYLGTAAKERPYYPSNLSVLLAKM